MQGKKFYRRIIGCLALGLLLTALLVAPALAKTYYCPPAEDLRLYIKNAEGQEVYVKHYSLSEMTTLLDGGEPVYYGQIDAMPIVVLGVAEGLSLEEFLDRVEADLQADYPDVPFDFDPVTTKCEVIAIDGAGRTIAADATPRYFYPHLYEYWDYEMAALKSDSSGTDYASLAFADAEEIKPILALRSYQERVGDGTGYIPGPITSPAELEAAKAEIPTHMDYNNAIRYIFGLTQEDVFNANSTASQSLKWLNKIVITPSSPPDIPSQGVCAPSRITAVQGPRVGECTVSFDTDTPDAQIYYSIVYRNTRDIAIGPCHLYDGTPITVNMWDNADGKIDLNPDDSIPLSDRGIRILAFTTKIGYLDSASAQTTYYYTTVHSPALTADTTDNIYGGAPIEITYDETDGGLWCSNITEVKVSSTSVDPAYYTIAPGKITLDNSLFIPGDTDGVVSGARAHYVKVESFGYKTASVGQLMLRPSPGLTADGTDNTVGQDITLTFMDDDAWRNAISSITVDGSPLDSGQYTVAEGSITINGSVFPTAKDYAIVVQAIAYNLNGVLMAYYTDAAVTQTVRAASGGLPSPALMADGTDNTVGRDITLTFADDEAWRSAISGISVDSTALESSQYTVTPGAVTIDRSVFATAKDYTIVVQAAGYSDAMVTQTVVAGGGGAPVYTVAAVPDAAYTIGTTPGGITTMTAHSGVSGLKYFTVNITPVVTHSGKETVIFTQLRDGAQLSLNATRADFDQATTAAAGFNIQAGDVIKAYIVDELTNATDSNPIILQ